MVFTLFVLLNILAIVLFFKFQRKNIHPIEIVTCWFVSTILFQNYSAFFVMNMKYFKIPEILSLELSHFLNRTVLIPMVTLIFINFYITKSKVGQKIIIFVSFFLLLGGVEFMEHFLGVLLHHNWKLLWSFAFWIIYLQLIIIFMKYFRKKLIREVKQS